MLNNVLHRIGLLIDHLIQFVKRKRETIAFHSLEIGKACYTSAIVTSVLGGINFNCFILLILGVLVTGFAQWLAR